MYINKAILYGNIVRDPELRALPGGSKVCSFSVATNRVWKDKEGAKKEEVQYHNVVAFGRTAELVHQWLKKGSGVLVEGRMQTRSWEQDGQKKYRTEIIADSIQFGPKGGSSAPTTKAAAPDKNDAPPADTIDYPEEEINPDDIPF